MHDLRKKVWLGPDSNAGSLAYWANMMTNTPPSQTRESFKNRLHMQWLHHEATPFMLYMQHALFLTAKLADSLDLVVAFCFLRDILSTCSAQKRFTQLVDICSTLSDPSNEWELTGKGSSYMRKHRVLPKTSLLTVGFWSPPLSKTHTLGEKQVKMTNSLWYTWTYMSVLQFFLLLLMSTF